MANKRIDELTAVTSLSVTDLMEVEQDPSGTKLHKKTTLQVLLDFINASIKVTVHDTLSEMKDASEAMLDLNFLVLRGLNAKYDSGYRLYVYDADSVAVSDDYSVVRPTIVPSDADPGRCHLLFG